MNKTIFTIAKIVILLFLSILLFIYGINKFYENLHNDGRGFYYLVSSEKKDTIQGGGNRELIKGDVVSGWFVSRYNSLGTILVRFYNGNRDSTDTVEFRIKEDGDDNWQYVANYKTDQFQPHELFPFGFPTVVSSVNKIYIYEIESLQGATGSGIYIDGIKPMVMTKYVFSKDDITSNPNTFASFLWKKVKNIFIDNYLVGMVINSFLPFYIFLAFLLANKHMRPPAIIIFFIVTIFMMITFEKLDDINVFTIIVFWIFMQFKFDIESKISFIFALIYTFMVPIFIFSNHAIYAENAAMWLYVFFSFGLVRQLFKDH